MSISTNSSSAGALTNSKRLGGIVVKPNVKTIKKS